MKQSKKATKAHIHVTVLTVVIVMVVIAAAGLFTYDHVHSQNKVINDSSADAVAGRFNSAMANGDRTEVGQLESPSFKMHLEAETTDEKNTKGEHGAFVTDNYYDVEKADGDLGLRFSVRDLTGAKVTFASYSAADGTQGVSALFSEASDSGSKITFSPSFVLNLIPAGSTWLVDGVTPYVNQVCNPGSGC